ncbi:hypothetical protein [Streptomyces sp. NRRL F-5702]|uniref:hypothetical protein n=1 Tax=Streptomyces sp. NRRL F-5702 TaxID=1463870 RepID=UPI00131D2E28|nr:hypothetical protein [Streptomyces sp. NRRL F-5702]
MSKYLPATPYSPGYATVPAPLSGPVQLHVERHQEQHEVVVWVPDATGRMVPVPRSHADALIAAVPATIPRDLTPQPLVDSRAQVVLAAGIGTGAAAAGIGYGLGQVLAPLAAVASSGLTAACPPPRGGWGAGQPPGHQSAGTPLPRPSKWGAPARPPEGDHHHGTRHPGPRRLRRPPASRAGPPRRRGRPPCP